MDYTSIRLNWLDNSSTETGFFVEDPTAFPWTFPANTTTTLLAGRRPGETVCVHIYAYNSAGNSDWTPYVCATTPTPVSAPIAPSGFTATAVNSGSIRFDWVDNSDNEAGFVVESPDTYPWHFEPNTTTWLISGMASGTTKCFRMYAYNMIGNSDWTPYTCATTP